MFDRLRARQGRLHSLFLAIIAMLALGGLTPASTARAEEPAIGPNYLRLTPISFSVIGDDNKVDLSVSIVLALELKSGVTEAMVEPFEPKIQDQALIVLTDLWESRPMNVSVPTTQIKDSLLPVIANIAGKDKIEQILILGIGENKRS